jgi:hypothetical protein
METGVFAEILEFQRQGGRKNSAEARVPALRPAVDW